MWLLRRLEVVNKCNNNNHRNMFGGATLGCREPLPGSLSHRLVAFKTPPLDQGLLHLQIL